MTPIDPTIGALLKRIYSGSNNHYFDSAGILCFRIPATFTDEERQRLAAAQLQPNQFVAMAHDECVSRLQDLANAVELRRAADAFVAALVSSHLAWSTVLPATALGLTMPVHAASRVAADRPCNSCFHTDAPMDRTQLAFFNLIDGSGWGVNGPLEAVLALEQALATPQEAWPTPSERDIWVFHQLLNLLRTSPARTRYSKAREAINRTGLLAVNTPARCTNLLEGLAFIGLLENPDHPGLFTRFTSAAERDRRPNTRIEVPGPLAWWSGEDGLNERLVERLFGHLPVPSGEPAAPQPVKPAKAAKAQPGTTTARSATISGPVAAGDIYAIRYREDLWGALYCHAIETDARGITRGKVEYLDVLLPVAPTAAQVRGLPYRDRLNGERCQLWCAGLGKTPGVKRIAAGEPAPTHPHPEPERIPFSSAKELGGLAGWHFKFPG